LVSFDVSADVREALGEEVSRQYSDLDHLLVQF